MLIRLLIFLHRWLGIAACLFFFTWFASGIVMMYAEMPQLSERERLAALPILDHRATVSAAKAIELAEVEGVSSIKLTSLFDRPAWRIRDSRGAWVTVFADDGDVRDTFQYEEAQASAAPFQTTKARPRLVETLDGPDQWTLEGDFRGLRPLYKASLDDPARTELYISSSTGEVLLRSTARTRAVAWVGAIPHWLYFTAIRRHGPFWSQLVIWLSAVGSFVALFGLIVGIWRFSPLKKYFAQGGKPSRSPYAGMMHWHHWAGLIFGIFTFTWVFSGMLSMQPSFYSTTGSSPTAAQAGEFSGPPLDTHSYDATPAQLIAAHPAVREIQLRQVEGRPYYLIVQAGRNTQLVDGAGRPISPFSNDFLLAAARRAVPGGKIIEQTQLDDYDAYYYDRDNVLPLPALRLKFDDPAQSWLYVDPARGAIVERYERSGRVERWLYHGFHSLDFPFLFRSRPAWDIVVIALSLGGIALSITGIVIGYRRLRSYVLGRGLV